MLDRLKPDEVPGNEILLGEVMALRTIVINLVGRASRTMSQEKIQDLIDHADRERFCPRRSESAKPASGAHAAGERKAAVMTSTDTEPFPKGRRGYGRGSRRNQTPFRQERETPEGSALFRGALTGLPTP